MRVSAKDRFKQIAIASQLEAKGESWRKIHEDRAKIPAVSGYLAVAIGLALLLLGRWSPQNKLIIG